MFTLDVPSEYDGTVASVTVLSVRQGIFVSRMLFVMISRSPKFAVFTKPWTISDEYERNWDYYGSQAPK